MNRWWRRPTTPAPTRTSSPPAATITAEDHDRQRAAIAETGRFIRRLRDIEPAAAAAGVVYACGYGSVPANVALAIADLDDARLHHAAHPDDPAAAAAVTTAEDATIRVFRAHGVTAPI